MYAGLLSYYSMRFYDYFEENWGSVMLYVHKDFYSTTMMNCYGGKYYNNLNSTDYYDLKCNTKDEIAYIWEEDIDKHVLD